MKKQSEVSTFYLQNLQCPIENRRNVIGFLVISMDFLGLLPLLSIPFFAPLVWAALIPIICIHICALLYIIAPYKFEKSYYLYIGVFGIVNTFVYFLVIQKFLYRHVGVEGSSYFVIGILLMFLLLVSIQIINAKMLYSGTYTKLQNGESKFNVSLIIAASSFGYIIAQFLMSYLVTDSAYMIAMITAYSVASILPAYLSTYIHRFIYIQNNYEKVINSYPDFGKPKTSRKFG